jgi:hypothetical protein
MKVDKNRPSKIPSVSNAKSALKNVYTQLKYANFLAEDYGLKENGDDPTDEMNAFSADRQQFEERRRA